MQNCDLEWSVDGQKWTKIATFENKRTIEIDVSDKDIQAQYVRIKNNATQKTGLRSENLTLTLKYGLTRKFTQT